VVYLRLEDDWLRDRESEKDETGHSRRDGLKGARVEEKRVWSSRFHA
jgi:ribosomal protein L19E